MMIKYLLDLPILLASPGVLADPATIGIPFRVSALEERVDALELNASAEVALLDSVGQPVGNVILVSTWSARIWMEFPSQFAIFNVGPDGFRVNNTEPENPKHVLLFETPDCNYFDDSAPVYAPQEHISESVWPQYHVIVAPEDGNGGARIPYAKAGENEGFPVASALWSDGHCDLWPPGRPPEQDPGLTPVTPVMQLVACDDSDDLHTCYPPPYELDRP